MAPPERTSDCSILLSSGPHSSYREWDFFAFSAEIINDALLLHRYDTERVPRSDDKWQLFVEDTVEPS